MEKDQGASMAHRLAWGPDRAVRDLEDGLCPCSHLELKTKCEQKYELGELQQDQGCVQVWHMGHLKCCTSTLHTT